MTFLSRILGLVRDVVVAKIFGAGAGTDVFLVAFKIPNFFRRLTAEASFAYAFVPVLTEYKSKHDHAAVQELVDKVAGAMAAVLFLMTLVGVIAAPALIGLFAPAWITQPAKFELGSAMLILTFPYLIFISLTALAGGILNTYNKFAIPAFTPVLLNISLISCALLLTPMMERPAMSLAIGVFIAGIAQLLFQIPYLIKINLLPKPKWRGRRQGKLKSLLRASAQCFVVIAELKKTRKECSMADRESAMTACDNRVAGALTSILFLITCVSILVLPVVFTVMGKDWYLPGHAHYHYWFSPGDAFNWIKIGLVVNFPFVLLMLFALMVAVSTRRFKRIFWATVFPALLFTLLITYVVWLAHQVPNSVWITATGAIGFGLIVVGIQVPFLMRAKVLPQPQHEGLKRIFTLMVPTLFSSSAMQISLLIDTWLASALITGSVSWLYFSDRLVEFPLGVFGIAIGTVILPALSRSHAQGSHNTFQQTLDWGIRWVILIGVPSTVGLFVLAGPLIITIFFRGEFTAEHAKMTSWALMAYSIGLMGFILVKVLSPGFYSRQDSKTPMKIAFVALGLKVFMSLLFLFLIITLIELRFAHLGLALSTALGATVNAALLYWVLRKRKLYHFSRSALMDALRIILSALLMGAFIYWMSPNNDAWLEMKLMSRVLQLSFLVGSAMALFLAITLALGVKPWRWKSGVS